MKYKKIKEWLESLIKVYHKTKATAEFDAQICICEPFSSGIHIYKGIEMVADVMGLALKEIKRDDAYIPYEYSFIYKGVKFFQITEERLEGYGAN